jgi:hypothetical protein
MIPTVTTAATIAASDATSPASENTRPGFRLVSHPSPGRNRANGGLAIARNCVYMGSRSNNQVEIVDISDASHPQPSASLAIPGTSTAIELRTNAERNLLVVATGSIDALHLYDIHDCLKPVHLSEVRLPSAPHEFYLWRDPANPARLLAYVAMFTSANGLHVVDLSNPAQPIALLTWGVPALSGLLHSISLADDGRRAYIAYWSGGLLIADTTDLAMGLSHPQIRLLGKLAYAPMSTHSAVRIPGRSLLALTDEIYACPFGWLHVVDSADPAQPRIAGEFRLPENRATPCAGGTWTAHNPLPLRDLLLLTWYDAGLLAIDTSDAAHPRLGAQFRVEGERFWSYPIIRDGLIYVASIEGGLYILAYDGPRAEEVGSVAFAEGNAN